MKARLIASIVVAGAVALGMSGCNLIAPQATLKHYDASDGVGVTVGSVAVRNAIVVSDDGETGNLVFSVANRDDRAHTVLIEIEGKDEQFQVLAEPGLTTFDGSGANDPLRIESLGTQPGAVLDVFFQYGDETGATASVPVLTGQLLEYSTLVPTPLPTDEPTETPTPLATPTTEPTE
ncbi:MULTISPECIES: hypothetical protein [unclassified Plantibacter]|uniref:hypothetical protein n=1 Tax=unclassified Plantibacter TaxID=2624265 RepID=UPI0012F16655|nr:MULTISPECIES: hypothetical protein [unclassified Plantibacter]MBD8467121.1 hypothetical protein [Plantibacter sp. CFBP 8798]VXB87029.1 conserved exported hypothetical protein [Plantibacter sp. T3]